jgi:hypothetical protein
MKMKEDTEKERLAQLEQEEMEKQKRLSRRSSSPALRHSQPNESVEVAERSAFSEPIPRHTQFVSLSPQLML